LAIQNLALFPHPPYSPDLTISGIKLKKENSGTVAGGTTRDSRVSVPVACPTVVEMLDPLHKSRLEYFDGDNNEQKQK
jgi:hypothetical protein